MFTPKRPEKISGFFHSGSGLEQSKGCFHGRGCSAIHAEPWFWAWGGRWSGAVTHNDNGSVTQVTQIGCSAERSTVTASVFSLFATTSQVQLLLVNRKGLYVHATHTKILDWPSEYLDNFADHKNKSVLTEGENLMLIEASCDAEGTYTCQAANHIETRKQSVYLSVIGKFPHIRF